MARRQRKTAAAPARELLVSDEAQVRALASPVRQALVHRLRRGGPASVRELAEALGRPAAPLYFHVDKLLAAGLLVELERRPTGRRPEAVYGLVAERLRITRDRKDESWWRAVDGLIRSHLRALERRLAAALRSEELPPGGTGHGAARAHFCASRVRLGTADRRELTRRLEDLAAFLDEATARAEPGDPALDWVVGLAPETGASED